MSVNGPGPIEPASAGDTPASTSGSTIGLRLVPVLLAPALAAAFAFSIYVITAAPGAWWGDGLELTAAAKTLGVPHPPGYPLYTLLGHLLLNLFASTDGGRVMTLFSAVLCALGSGLAGGVAYAILRDEPQQVDSTEPRAPVDRGASLLVALGATLCVAFSRTLWEHATFAEVYPLTFFLVTAMALLVVWPGPRGHEPGLSRAVLVALLAGLSTLNHYSAIAAGPLVLFATLSWGRVRSNAGGFIGMLLAIVAICLLGYVWIPFRAAANPPLNFGNADSFGGLIWMLTGGDYGAIQALRSGSASAWSSGAERWLSWWGEQLLGPGRTAVSLVLGAMMILGATIGNLLLAIRRPAWGWGGLALLGATLGFSIFYRIPDIEGYFLPAIPALIMGYAELTRRSIRRTVSPQGRLMIGATVGVLLLTIGLGMLRLHLDKVDKSWDRGPEIWASELLRSLPEDALVLTRQGADSEIYALWYAQMVSGQRPDVSVFGTGFIFSAWYAAYFEAAGRPRIPIFVTDRPPGQKADYDVALIGGIIVPNLRERRVFVTFQDPVLERYFSPRPVSRLLPEEYYERTAYRLNPPGPVLYELRRSLQFEPHAMEKFQERYPVNRTESRLPGV